MKYNKINTDGLYFIGGEIMEIRFVGVDYRCDEDFHICRPNGSGNYLFVMFKTPSIVLINNETVMAEPDMFILYEKGESQDYRAYGNTFEHDFIEFELDEQSELLLIDSIPLNILIKAINPQILTSSIHQITMGFFENSKYKTIILNLLGQLLLLRIREQAESCFQIRKSNHYLDALLTIRSEIYRNPQMKWTVQLLAQKIPLSISYFQGLYKESFGISCLNDVIAARMNLAKYYLLYTNKTVSRIANICGYENDVHFMRQFKAIVKMTPKDYRKSSQNDQYTG